MRIRQVLTAVSAAQLAVGVEGQLVALHQRRAFKIFRWHGNSELVARESWLLGTGLSAPVAMMFVQAGATAVLSARPSRRAAGTLGALGAAMAGGCLIENDIRSAMRSGGWDPVVTPLGGASLGLASVMAVAGLRAARNPELPPLGNGERLDNQRRRFEMGDRPS